MGNLDAHALGRLSSSYAALKLVEAARDLNLLRENSTIVATRAMVQDKRTSREFPAAHRIPGEPMTPTKMRQMIQELNASFNKMRDTLPVQSDRDKLDTVRGPNE